MLLCHQRRFPDRRIKLPNDLKVMAPIANKTINVAEEGNLRGDDRRLARVRLNSIKLPENAV